MLMQDKQNKQVSFRNQIRKKQLQQILAHKRQILNNCHSSTNYLSYDSDSMYDLLVYLKSMLNLNESIVKLGNILFEQKSLFRLRQQKGDLALKNFCINLTYLIFNTIIPSQNRASSDGIQLRKNCLVVISNLVADVYIQKQCLIPIIAQGLSSVYGSLGEYGNSIQIIEIGWIIGNILCQKLVDQAQIENSMQIILSWANQILALKDLQLTSFIYKSLTQFYKNLDEKYRINQQKYVEHFKTYRLILLEQAIQQNFTSKLGSALFYVLKFIRKNLDYLDISQPITVKNLLSKCIEMIKKLCQQKNLTEILQIIRYLSKKEQFTVVIFHQGFESIVTLFTNSSMNIKQLCLDIMIQVVIDKQQAIQLLKPNHQLGLQPILNSFIRNIPNTDILMKILSFCVKIVQLTDHQCGESLVNSIQQNLILHEGEVGKMAFKIVQFFNNHQ